MNKKPLLLIFGVVLIASAMVLSTVVALPVQIDDTSTADFDQNNGDVDGDGTVDQAANETTFSMLATLTDENGDVVRDLPFAFTYSGVEVAFVDVLVSWNVQGVDMDWNTFQVYGHVDFTQGYNIWVTRAVGELEILYFFQRDTLAVSMGYDGRDANGLGSAGDTFALSLIDPSKPEYEGGNTYLIGIDVALTFTCNDLYGATYTENYNQEGLIRLGWIEEAGSWSVVATTDYEATAFDATGGTINPIENPAVATLIAGFAMVSVQILTMRKRK